MYISGKLPVSIDRKNVGVAILGSGNDPLSRNEAFGLYFAIPAVLAFLLGWNQTLFGSGVSRLATIAFAMVLVFGLWASTIVCTNLVYALLRRLSPPLWMTATLGVVVAALLILPLARFYLLWGYEWAGVTQAADKLGTIGFNLTYFRKFFANVVPGGLCWILVNYFYRDVLYARRYGTEARTVLAPAASRLVGIDSVASQEPTFVAMLPSHQRGALIALKAEDHYLQVYTENGSGLVRWRFADALNAVASLKGLQVHRSYWVNTAFVRTLHRHGHALELEMKNGLKFPVSRAYAKNVKAALGAEV